MKNTTINFAELSASFKTFFCKMLLTGLFPVALMLFSAVVGGDFPLLPGIAVGLVLLLLANALCGVILPAEQLNAAPAQPVRRRVPRTATSSRAARPAVALRVVNGGRAA